MTSIVLDKKKIRLAFVQPEYSRNRLPFYKLMQDHYDVDFFFLNQANTEPTNEYLKEFLSVEVLAKKKHVSDRWFSPEKKYLLLLLSLTKKRYSAIITSCISPQTIISLFASKIIGSKYILWIEDWFIPNPKSVKAILRLSLLNLISKCVLKNANAVIVEGSPQRRFVRYFGAPNEKVFLSNHSSLDYSKFNNVNIRQNLNIRKGFVILYLARIIKSKGLDILIKAFSKIEQEVKDAYLVIVGDGDFRDSCVSIVKEKQIKHIIFVGSISQEEKKASFYKMADVFVLPSRIIAEQEIAEGWGLVINEAMSMGKPIITTDAVGAAEDLVRNGVNGYIVKNGEIEELYIALKKIIDSPKLKESMSKNSRILFEKFNDFRKMSAGFENAINYSLDNCEQQKSEND